MTNMWHTREAKLTLMQNKGLAGNWTRDLLHLRAALRRNHTTRPPGRSHGVLADPRSLGWHVAYFSLTIMCTTVPTDIVARTVHRRLWRRKIIEIKRILKSNVAIFMRPEQCNQLELSFWERCSESPVTCVSQWAIFWLKARKKGESRMQSRGRSNKPVLQAGAQLQ